MLLLNAPYFEGVSSVDADVPGLFPVAIAGHPYKIELREYERSTLDVIRQQADQSNVPSERSFNPYALWRRSLETWHHGAGQDNIDLQDESDPARFRSSKGIDPWTRGQIGLLPRQVWADRILDEARQTADPVHLVRLFGIHPSISVKYVQAAHPDKALPRIR